MAFSQCETAGVYGRSFMSSTTRVVSDIDAPVSRLTFDNIYGIDYVLLSSSHNVPHGQKQ